MSDSNIFSFYKDKEYKNMYKIKSSFIEKLDEDIASENNKSRIAICLKYSFFIKLQRKIQKENLKINIGLVKYRNKIQNNSKDKKTYAEYILEKDIKYKVQNEARLYSFIKLDDENNNLYLGNLEKDVIIFNNIFELEQLKIKD